MIYNEAFWKKQLDRPFVHLVDALSKNRCPLCNFHYKEALITDKDKVTDYQGIVDKETRLVFFVSGEVPFHLKSTHGFDWELFLEMMGVKSLESKEDLAIT